jgi:cell division protein FtsB
MVVLICENILVFFLLFRLGWIAQTEINLHKKMRFRKKKNRTVQKIIFFINLFSIKIYFEHSFFFINK